MTGLNSLAYSASHARKDAILSLAKEGETGREEGAGPRMQCQPSLPPWMGDVRGGGRGVIQNS